MIRVTWPWLAILVRPSGLGQYDGAEKQSMKKVFKYFLRSEKNTIFMRFLRDNRSIDNYNHIF